MLDVLSSADNTVIDTIVQLAREHQLVLYEPEAPAITLHTVRSTLGRSNLPESSIF